MSFDRMDYGPLNWYITIDGEVHEVKSVQRISTAKKILRKRLGRPIPRNCGYTSQREGMIGYYAAGQYGTHAHQKHWFLHGGGFVNWM